MLSAVAAWFASKGLGLLLGYAFNFVLDIFKTYQANAAQRDAGRAEANADTLRQGAERVQEANTATIEADSQHGAHPDDDSAFDRDFERK